MIIDIHTHTKYSVCSNMELEEAIIQAKKIGLDALCVTDHESNEIYNEALSLSKKHDFLVIVGMEILTLQGDLLIFGLDEVPKQMMNADELVRKVHRKGGIAISAHPFRDNDRGMGNTIKDINGLSGIEVFNGNTKAHHNQQAHALARELNIPCLGGSDAHSVDRIGYYATVFPEGIRDVKDLINAVNAKEVYPVVYKA